jgi:hypothetical protein
VGDPEVVYIESLGWKEVWIKVASKEPRSIKGTSEVYINKIGCLIIWEAVDPKISKPTRGKDDKNEEEEELTNEEDPDSHDYFGGLVT